MGRAAFVLGGLIVIWELDSAAGSKSNGIRAGLILMKVSVYVYTMLEGRSLPELRLERHHVMGEPAMV